MLNAIQRQLLKKLISYSGTKKIAVRKSILPILEEIGFNVSRGEILLSTEEKLQLIKFVKKKYGENLERNAAETAKDRFELAKEIQDEKRGRKSVFGDLLNFAGNTDLVFKDNTSICLNVNAVVSCELELIDINSISSLVVVENGTNIIRSKELFEILPKSLKSTLILYKGHGDNIKQFHSLIEKLNSECSLYYFFDYDPAGFFMMINEASKRESYLLLPPTLTDEVIRLNKHDCFIDQQKYMQCLYQRLQEFSSELKIHIEYMKKNELAITQENIVSHGLKLDMVPVFNNDI